MKKEKLEILESPKKKEKRKKESSPLLKVESVSDVKPKEEVTPSKIENLRSEIKDEFNESKKKELSELKETREELINRINTAEREYELSSKGESSIVNWVNRILKKENNSSLNKVMEGEINFLKNELEKVEIDISELEK
ncbi:MAG: hypothetical protein UT05_C0003G0095 [Parcubacteria group bacterium GW2011_GWF2_38_76]|nr:MAG: hypothetical protein UT05_C0003G0095 [Parcubacteria group bacterium GW2011_GWF2_38_76]HBM46132.1 hypothetical protein [Patescibacteria group bacterium]